MEKFSLKWNDFEANASKSFRNLRKEEHFFDVTLVSDDEQIVSAHKLVLSASSQFFKNLLKKSTHSNPLVYLPGVKSAYLNSIIDYIYDGEVQLYQDNLDDFLDVAHKLKIEGLIEGKNVKDEFVDAEAETFHQEQKWGQSDENTDSNIVAKNDIVFKPRKTKYDEYEKTVSLVDQEYSKEDLAKVIDDLIIKDGGMSICKSCGKSSKWNKQIKHHVEMHIEGLSLPCPHCEQTFRSRNILKCHKQTFHKKC